MPRLKFSTELGEKVFKDRHKNLRWRQYVINRCFADLEFRRQIMIACKQDPIFWINVFAVQYNPDELEVAPFVTYDFQDEAVKMILNAVNDKKDVRWPKSRKLGASWLALMVATWMCLFKENVKILAMSRDEDTVDRPDDPDSLFWKVRWLHKYLPIWMRGPIKSARIKSTGAEEKGIRERSMGFTYERTNSNFTGEANVESAGVGGRATLMILDEFGQFKKGYEIFSMTRDTALCRLFIFTHKTNSGMAYDLCFDPKYARMREILTHWTQHPQRKLGMYRYVEQGHKIEVLDKTYAFPPDFKFVYENKPTGGPFPGIRSPWYDEEALVRSERDLAMNVDIDPRGAANRLFDAFKVGQLKAQTREPYFVGGLKYNRDTGKPQELFSDPAGCLKMWVNAQGPARMPVIATGGGCDVAAGVGASPSCLSIWNAENGEKILEYVDARISPIDFATFAVAVCRMFLDKDGRSTMLIWEQQGGQAFGLRVRQLGYGHVYISRNEVARGRPRNKQGKAGFGANPESNYALMEQYKMALYDGRAVNYSWEALDECLNFVYTHNSVEYRGAKHASQLADENTGATIHHGDIAKADALGWKMVEELGKPAREEQKKNDWIDPRSMAGRMKLAQQEKWKEAELEWA